MPGCLLLLFPSERKRKIMVRRQREGRQIYVQRGRSWERQRLCCCVAQESLMNLCLGCWKLFLGHACKGLWDGAEQDLGEGREESEDVKGGGEDVEKTKQLQGRRREEAFSLIRRTWEKAQIAHAHTPPLLHTLTPQKKKIHHTDFFMVWQSSDKIIRWGSHSPFLQSLSPSAPRLK